MRMGRGLVLLLAFSSAAGAAILVHKAPSPANALRPQKSDMAEILVAARAIAVGEQIGPEQVRWQSWPRALIPAGGIIRPAQASAKALPFEAGPARHALLAGEPVSLSKLARAQQGGVLAGLVSPGMRAVAVPIREETAAGGFIQPYDTVDVIVTRKRLDGGRESARSEILLRGVKVLAMGKAAGGKAQAPGRTATLELPPPQARMLAAAMSASEVSLALIGTADLAAGMQAAAVTEPPAEISIVKFGRPSAREGAQ